MLLGVEEQRALVREFSVPRPFKQWPCPGPALSPQPHTVAFMLWDRQGLVWSQRPAGTQPLAAPRASLDA